jgi:hypothetical protein
MDAMLARPELERLIAAAEKSVGDLYADDSVDCMLDFYRQVRPDCALIEEGDMLLFQWGTYDWGQGPSFEFDLTRQYAQAPSGEDEGLTQLHLTLRFAPSDSLRALGSGNRWCSAPAGIDEFRDFIISSDALLGVRELKPRSVELVSEVV